MYPNFYRIRSRRSYTWIALAERMGWHTISMISDINPDNVDEVKRTMAAFHQLNITVAGIHFFDKDPSEAIERLKKSGSRIIYVNCYLDTCPKIACQAYLQRLYGSRIIWVFFKSVDFIHTNVELDEECTPENLRLVEKGNFVKFTPISTTETYLNFTDDSFQSMLAERIDNYWKHPFRKFRAMCFDTIVTGIHTLNMVERELNKKGSSLRFEIESFNDTKNELVDLFKETLNKIDIQLFASRMKYANGRHEIDERSGYRQNLGNGSSNDVFFDHGFDSDEGKKTRFEFLSPIQWFTPDGKAPALEPKKQTRTVVIDPVAREILSVFAILTIAIFGHIIGKELHKSHVRFKFRMIFIGVPLGMISFSIAIWLFIKLDPVWFCCVTPILCTFGLCLISAHIFVALSSRSSSIRKASTRSRSTSLVISFQDESPVLNFLNENAPIIIVIIFIILSMALVTIWYLIGGLPSTTIDTFEEYDEITDEMTLWKLEQCSVNRENRYHIPLAIAVFALQIVAAGYTFLISIGFMDQKCHSEKLKAIRYSYILFPAILLSIFLGAAIHNPFHLLYSIAPVIVFVSFSLAFIYYKSSKSNRSSR